MADTGNRTLRLLSLMQNRRHWSGTDLADPLGVSLRTVRRDIERLRDLGYPVEADDRGRGPERRRHCRAPGADGGGVGLPRHRADRLRVHGRRWGAQRAARRALSAGRPRPPLVLVVYDLDRGDWRSFRLAAPRGTGSRFAPRTLPADGVRALRDWGARFGRAAAGTAPVA